MGDFSCAAFRISEKQTADESLVEPGMESGWGEIQRDKTWAWYYHPSRLLPIRIQVSQPQGWARFLPDQGLPRLY